ncbi:uncharacterized protein [Tiliqua scincoides]|uniref:uncharacterized protein n=1 Tax=Tiliqua scincoides TaxID=71010 RepID=UPI0034621AD7
MQQSDCGRVLRCSSGVCRRIAFGVSREVRLGSRCKASRPASPASLRLQRAFPAPQLGGRQAGRAAPSASLFQEVGAPAARGVSLKLTEPPSQTSMAAVVSRVDSPGTDVFVTRHGSFIVRSDLGCFLHVPDFCSGQDIKVQDLHPACRGGDHYVADPTSSTICILRGDTFCKVLNLSSEQPTNALPLHPSCQGGDHYASCEGLFFIFFLSRGQVLSVADLATGAAAKEVHLESPLLRGLYYYGTDATHLACFRVDEDNNLRGHRFAIAGHEEVFSLHPDVASFLPGGLALIHGPAFGVWECLKLISNATDLPLPSSHEITRKVGYSKVAFSQKFSTSESLDSESLVIALLQSQFSLPTIYGGMGLRTEQEEWEEVAEEGEPLRVILQPRQKLYWWQYRLGLGKEPILFCRSLKVTRSPTPPTHIPLPSADS